VLLQVEVLLLLLLLLLQLQRLQQQHLLSLPQGRLKVQEQRQVLMTQPPSWELWSSHLLRSPLPWDVPRRSVLCAPPLLPWCGTVVPQWMPLLQERGSGSTQMLLLVLVALRCSVWGAWLLLLAGQ
jgi:hypothetical protein